MDMSVTVIMRTEYIEEAINKWTGGKPGGVSYRTTIINDVASQVDIEETKRDPLSLIEILKSDDEPYYILIDYWNSDLIPWNAYCSSDYDEKLLVIITPEISLDIEPA